MKKSLILILIIQLFSSLVNAQNKSFCYNYAINLNNVVNDQLEVTLRLEYAPDTSIFQFPAIIPGTYKIYDFGRFIQQFRAFDKNNKLLEVIKISTNQWKIPDYLKVRKIKYWVEDTWDTLQPHKVFEPAGTNIDDGKVFVLNNHGFFGYFQGQEENQFKIKVYKPERLFGGSALHKTAENSIFDVYEVDNYHRLVDNPIIYTEADTASLEIGKASVFVSLYSPNKKLNAQLVVEKLRDVLEGQKNFLKNKLPTNHYSFLIFLTDEPSNSGAMGALEHWNCSFYFLPEEKPSKILPVIQEIAAHEFFHIITPLSIHSEEIAHFDYNNPKMSKHLWLYEGVTEYFAGLALVQNHLITEEQYLESILSKIITAKSTYKDDLAFTELSEFCLDKHSNQYGNVYEKGALIALGLDLVLLENSNGEYNLRDLMLDLSDTLGASKAFKDDQLFELIEDVSGISASKEFLEKYVASPTPFPYSTIFKKVGINYQEEYTNKTTTFGNVGISINDDNEIVIDDITDIDSFGKKMGYQIGDVLLKMNNIPITYNNIGELMNDYINEPEKHSKLKLHIRRKGKLINLKSKVLILEKTEFNVFEKLQKPSDKERNLYQQWLKQ